MHKVEHSYIPYTNGKWNAEVCKKMKEETGFDPGVQQNGIPLTTKYSREIFFNDIPKGKTVSYSTINNFSDGLSCITVTITELVKDEEDNVE